MSSHSLNNYIGSGHKKWWSEYLALMRTLWGNCHPWGLRRINPRIQKVTRDSLKQGTTESTHKVEEAGSVRTLEPGTLEKLVNYLVPAQRCGDPFFVPAFLCTYRRFATTQQVLDLLFLRYGFFHPKCEEDQKNKSALSSLLETWLLQYPGDFCQGPDLASLKKLIAYALINLPNSEILPEVCRLLARRGTR